MVLRQCTVCGRRFNKTEHFKRHERSHTREKPYKCAVCGKAFSRSDVLFRHQKGHVQREDDDASPIKAERRDTTSESALPQLRQSQSQEIKLDARTPHFSPPSLQTMTSSTGDQQPRHVSMDMSTHQDSPHTQPNRLQEMLFPNGWRSPVIPTSGGSVQNPHHPSPSQRSAEASTFGTTASSSLHPAPTPHSDIMMTQDGGNHVSWLSQDGFPTDFHDPFQMWLFPSLGDLDQSPDFLQTYDTGTTPNFALQDSKLQGDIRLQDSVERSKNISKVPRERFSRVQRCWASRPHRVHRIMPSLWRNVIASPIDNVFADDFDEDEPENSASGWGFDAECRLRLKDHFRTPAPTRQSSPKPHNDIDAAIVSRINDSADFPPPEILDIALGLFFRRFHPTVPFIHTPTFSVKSVPPPMLFVMCLIGLSILGTTGAMRFVSKMFPSFLERVSNDMAACTSGTALPLQQLTIYATALLTLHLATMTGDKDSLTQCQMLYASLVAVCQQNGLFNASDGGDLNALMSDLHESEYQWKAWSRIESTKRLILSLVTLESFYSNLLSRPPIIRSESGSLIAPCSDDLFNAKSATQWQSLIRSGHSILAPTLTIQDLHTGILTTLPTSSLGFLGTSSLLALLQIQTSESYHRLMPSSPTQLSSALIPHHLYANDLKARSLTPTVLAATQLCTSPTVDTNTLVLWHALNISLLSDPRMFELAAGRHGPAPAHTALESISQWTQTSAARRAVVHAAQTFRLMSERKVSENVTVHSVAAVFEAALVVGLWLFMCGRSNNFAGRNETVELLDGGDDWVSIGSLGYENDTSGFVSDGVGGGGGDLAHDGTEKRPIHHFIKYGGMISLNGVPQQGGYESARRVLLDFANLMDGISGRRLRAWTQVLHIMSDDLMNIDNGV